MKASGLPSFGRVPNHWEIKRLKTVCNMRSGDGITEESIESVGDYPVYGGNGIRGYTSKYNRDGTLVLIGRQGALCGNIHVARGRFWASDHAVVVTPRSDDSPEWVGAILESMDLNQYSVSAAQPGLSVERVLSLPVPVPPVLEQSSIVRFLDHTDKHIHRYIRAKQKLIALLEEQKQAIIHQAVTGQIDVRTGQPYRAYRPSGVEGLQDVPAHWEMQQIGRFGRLFKGRGGTKEDDSECGVPCVRYGDLYTQHQFFITASRACVAPEAASEYTPVRYGDVLFAGSGETIDEIGKSAVNLIRGSACCGGDVIIMRPSIDVDVRFLGYATDCPQAAQQKARMGRGITVMHIYGSELKRLTVALPPLREQRGIVGFLDRIAGKLTAGVTASRRQIERVREYRIRLIADVVTGKLDVRKAAAELPDDDSPDRAEDSADEHAVDQEVTE